MWIILNNAFFSIVENNYNSDELLVRSRVDGDIQKLFPNAQVLVNHGSDYKYRAFIDRREVAKAIEWEILDIDYGNFKHSVEDKRRRSVYDIVWSKLLELQN